MRARFRFCPFDGRVPGSYVLPVTQLDVKEQAYLRRKFVELMLKRTHGAGEIK